MELLHKRVSSQLILETLAFEVQNYEYLIQTLIKQFLHLSLWKCGSVASLLRTIINILYEEDMILDGLDRKSVV